MPEESAGAKLDVQALRDACSVVGGEGVSIEGAKDSKKLSELASQVPVVRLVDIVLSEAVTRRASDVHIEAFENMVRIRYRIDGICYQVAEPPKSLALAMASRIKIMANLDVAETRLPQDGRILITQDNRDIDLRVSTLPTIYGESIVLRVLDKRAVNKSLEELGMGADVQEAMQALIRRPHGLVLVTGPTGSGKTTTLYACLASLNRDDVKIVTTEDPVEYDIRGLVQVAINQKIALTFATCLRAILRHDPDVIMVGEIRDLETAQVAIQAALTGHLVFSTLHTNDAPGAVTRLLDMGVEPFLITSTVNAVMGQRLVRRLCPACRKPTRVSATVQAMLATVPGERAGAAQEPTVMQALGCDACQGLGFQGRTGIYELFTMDEAMRRLVLERASVTELRRVAHDAGMRTLRQDGLRKVRMGETLVEEILRETQDVN